MVKQIIEGLVATNDFINANPADAQQAVSDGIAKLTGKPLDAALTAAAWKSITFLNDPHPELAASRARSTPRRSACSSPSTSTESTTCRCSTRS